jgi:hypothetical protein
MLIRRVVPHGRVPTIGLEIRHLPPRAERIAGRRDVIPLVHEALTLEPRARLDRVALRAAGHQEPPVGHPVLPRTEQLAAPRGHCHGRVMEAVLGRRLTGPEVGLFAGQ